MPNSQDSDDLFELKSHRNKRRIMSASLLIVGGFLLANGFGLSAMQVIGLGCVLSGALNASLDLVYKSRKGGCLSEDRADRLHNVLKAGGKALAPMTQTDLVDANTTIIPVGRSDRVAIQILDIGSGERSPFQTRTNSLLREPRDTVVNSLRTESTITRETGV